MTLLRYTVVTVLLTAPISAADLGGLAGSFLRVGTAARSRAMGGGFTAAIDNGFTAYHNPAAVAFLEKRRVSVFHHFLPLDRYLVSASFASSLPPTGGMGVGLLSAGVDDIDGRDQGGFRTEMFSTSEYAVYFSFSNKLFEALSVGVNVKLLQHVIPLDGNQTSRGIGVDFGIMIKQFENLDLGIVIQDLNAGYSWNTGDIFDEKGRSYRDPFPVQLRTGFAYRSNPFNIVGDYTYFSSEGGVTAHRIRMGGEFKTESSVALRAGVNNFTPAIGAGLNYSLLKRDDAFVDYAFVLGTRGEGFSHVFTYVFTF